MRWIMTCLPIWTQLASGPKDSGKPTMVDFLHTHAAISCLPLEKAMAPHSSTLAWRIPGTEEPSGLPSMGSHRVGHNWSDLAVAAAAAFLNTFVHFFTQQTLSHPSASVTHYAYLFSCSTPLKLFMRLLPPRAKIFKYRKISSLCWSRFALFSSSYLAPYTCTVPANLQVFRKQGDVSYLCFLVSYLCFLMPSMWLMSGSICPFVQHILIRL